MSKVTLSDVARAAGLSPATVDRVLNGRGGASPTSRERVAAAVQELRFRELPRDFAARSKPKLKFAFVLPPLGNSFTAKMVASVLEAPAAVDDCRITNQIYHVDLDDPEAIVGVFKTIEPGEYDGVALFAVDSPGVREQINRLVDSGLKVVSLVTDLAESRRHHFVGIDNLAAGRAAGTLMGRFLRGVSGRVAIILGSHSSLDQYDRQLGFEEVLRSRFANLRLVPAIETRSDRARNRRVTRQLFEKYDDLVGLYSAGAGNTGIIDALEAADTAESITFIMHELTARARTALRSGVVAAVINQDTGHMARSAVRVLKALCLSTPIVRQQEKVCIEIYIADNAPTE